MALWELDEFQGAQFLGFVRNVPTPEAFSGASFLPNRTVFDLEVSYVKGTQYMPAMASVITWDAEAPIGGKPGLGEKVTLELPPIKRKERIAEKEIIRFLTPRAGTPDVQIAIDEVYNITRRLLDGVHARVEWLRMQALTEPTLVYAEDGIQITFDYGFDPVLQVDQDVTVGLGDNWDIFATANPVADIQFVADLYEDTTGFRLEQIVLSRKAVAFALQSAPLRDLIRGSGAPAAQLAQSELDTLFELYDLPRLTPYDVKVYEEDSAGVVAQIRTMDFHKAIALPSFLVGETLYGPTAESRGTFGTPLAQEAPGLWATVYGTEDPPTEWVKAVATAIPSLHSASGCSGWTIPHTVKV